MNVKEIYVVVPYQLLYLNLKLSSAKLSHFRDIRRAFGAIMFLLEPKWGESGWSLGLFCCWILYGLGVAWYRVVHDPTKWLFCIYLYSSQLAWRLLKALACSIAPQPTLISYYLLPVLRNWYFGKGNLIPLSVYSTVLSFPMRGRRLEGWPNTAALLARRRRATQAEWCDFVRDGRSMPPALPYVPSSMAAAAQLRADGIFSCYI